MLQKINMQDKSPMPDVRTKIKGKCIKGLNLEQIQSTILWIYGCVSEGKRRSPSFFSIKNREHLRSANLVFVFSMSMHEEAPGRLIRKNLEKTHASLRENISLEDTARLILKKIDRTKIDYRSSNITKENIKSFLIQDLGIVFSNYQQQLPSNVSLFGVDCSEFVSFSATSSYFLVSLDCEMVETEGGHEVGRVSLVDHNYNMIYDSYIKPKNKVVNLLTEYSGLTEADLESGISFEKMQLDLEKIIGKDTVVLGHSLDSDLTALKIYHEKIVDTSHLFITKDDKRLRLKELVLLYFKEEIQGEEHCPVQDAKACLDLLRYKISELEMLEKSKDMLDLGVRINYTSISEELSDGERGALMSRVRNLETLFEDKSLNIILIDHGLLSEFIELYSKKRCSVFYYFYVENGRVRVAL